VSHTVAQLDDLERVPFAHSGDWRPIRRALGITSVAVNAYTADEAGAPLIEPHDELGPGSGHHEEIYVVVTGHATFTIAGEEVDAPTGTIVKISPEDKREARAVAPGTTVLVLGGKPGAALPVSPYEYWYAAEPAYQAGDYERAIEVASEGLSDYPQHGTLHYQLACYKALAGRREEAIEHLRAAYAGDPRTREWAKGDGDLDSVRDAL
jgi:tetratricopeptide (TPR) repeat protein